MVVPAISRYTVAGPDPLKRKMRPLGISENKRRPWRDHRRSRPALFVPKTSVVTTTERTFVVRDRNGHAEWVDVRKGSSEGDLMEATGSLQAGDRVVRRATDELREGTVQQAPTK